MKFAVLAAHAALLLAAGGVEFSPGLIDQRISAMQPSVAEKRFDEIGWAPGLLAAEAIAAKEQRPVFLFTPDGRMNLGRC